MRFDSLKPVAWSQVKLVCLDINILDRLTLFPFDQREKNQLFFRRLKIPFDETDVRLFDERSVLLKHITYISFLYSAMIIVGPFEALVIHFRLRLSLGQPSYI